MESNMIPKDGLKNGTKNCLTWYKWCNTSKRPEIIGFHVSFYGYTNGTIPPKGLKLLGYIGFHVSFYGYTNGTIPPNATKDGLSDPEIPISAGDFGDVFSSRRLASVNLNPGQRDSEVGGFTYIQTDRDR